MRALEIEKEIKKGTILPGYVITGDDEYLKRFVKESLLATIPKQERMFSYIPLDLTGPNKTDMGSVTAAAETYSMMFSSGPVVKKMIDVQPFESALSKSDEKILKEYFSSPASDSFILFEGSQKNENFLTSICEEVDCSKCDDTELYIFIDKKRAKQQYQMDSQIIKELIKLCNNDFGRVATELEKLFMFEYDSKTITKESLKLLVPASMDMQMYELTNALSSGKNQEAIKILQALKKRGERSSAILGLLSSTYRRLFQIAISTSPDDVVMSAIKVSNSALMMNRKIVMQNRNKDKAGYIPKMKKAVEYLAKLEYMMKTYQVTEDKALDLAMAYLMTIQEANGRK